jgi:hypothetical protein
MFGKKDQNTPTQRSIFETATAVLTRISHISKPGLFASNRQNLSPLQESGTNTHSSPIAFVIAQAVHLFLFQSSSLSSLAFLGTRILPGLLKKMGLSFASVDGSPLQSIPNCADVVSSNTLDAPYKLPT